MKRFPIKSSNLHSVGYDAANLLLEVEFKSGSVYQYFNVPIDIYEQLLQAPSAGKFFNKNIASKFRYANIGYQQNYSFTLTKNKIHNPYSPNDIRKLYHNLAHKFHPDINSSSDKIMKEINRLYDERNFYELKVIAKKYGIE